MASSPAAEAADPIVAVAARLAGQVRAAAPAPGLDTRVVGIDGCGGAGKSTLAEALSAALRDAPVVHTDDFASWDNPVGWWPRLLRQVLRPLALGQRPRYQRYDWARRRLAEWVEIPSAAFLIIEGITATRAAFTPYLAFRIWVETPRDVRLRRGLERDGENMAGQWAEWMAAEDAYVKRERPREHADAIASGHI